MKKLTGLVAVGLLVLAASGERAVSQGLDPHECINYFGTNEHEITSNGGPWLAMGPHEKWPESCQETHDPIT